MLDHSGELREENEAYMEKGLIGVKMSLKILSEYYAGEDKAHEAASGAGNGIIDLLEVFESDFTKNLAEMVSTEESGAASFDRATKDNQIEKATKDKDVEYKIKESTYLDKESSELSTDREGVQAELEAVLEYLSKFWSTFPRLKSSALPRQRRTMSERGDSGLRLWV